MKRREFLKSSAALAATSLPAVSAVAQEKGPDVINVGHLVGICMSPLFFADAMGYFKDEKLNVQLKFMPNPGDALAALTSGQMNMVHVPFTNFLAAANNGAPVRIIAGSGAGGIFLVSQGTTGIKSMDDLVKAKGKGLKIGAMRVNTFELMLYRALTNAGLSYSDFQMVWFNDTLSMAAAFEAKAVDLVTHVEPFSTKLVDQLGGIAVTSNLAVWGPDGPDCVTGARADFIQKYPDTHAPLHQGAAARRPRDQERPRARRRGARQGQVLPRRREDAARRAAAADAAGRSHEGRRQGHGDRDQRHDLARLHQEAARRRHRLLHPDRRAEGLT